MSQADNSALKAAVTCLPKNYLTNDESEEILAGIQKKIISEACSPQQGTHRPTFNAQPLFEDGVIKLWCANNYTLNWLKQTVSKLSVPDGPNLVVMSQSEIQKRILGIFVIPDKQGVFKGPFDIRRTLCYQNPFIDFDKLEILSTLHNTHCQEWLVRMMFPEDQKRVLENAGCILSIGLTEVKVEFDNPPSKSLKCPVKF